MRDNNQPNSLNDRDCAGVRDENPLGGNDGPKCEQCKAHDGTERPHTINGRKVWLHKECEHFWLVTEAQEQRW